MTAQVGSTGAVASRPDFVFFHGVDAQPADSIVDLHGHHFNDSLVKLEGVDWFHASDLAVNYAE